MFPLQLPQPVNDVAVIFPEREESAPEFYSILDKTVSGKHKADLNKGSGGTPVLLAVRRVPAFAALPTAALFPMSAVGSPPSSGAVGAAPFSTAFETIAELPLLEAAGSRASPHPAAGGTALNHSPAPVSASARPADSPDSEKSFLSVAQNSSTAAQSDTSSSAVASPPTRTLRAVSSASSFVPPAAAQSTSATAASWFRPITGVHVIFGDADEEPPPGWTCVSRSVAGRRANLNQGTVRSVVKCTHALKSMVLVHFQLFSFIFHVLLQIGHHIFLCLQRGSSGAGGGDGVPLLDVGLFNPRKEGTAPRGYGVVARTPNGRVASLNKGNEGEDMFLVYKPGIRFS
jgi:hypothetical protein